MQFKWPDTAIEIVIIVVLMLVVRALIRMLIRRSLEHSAEKSKKRQTEIPTRINSELLRDERQEYRIKTLKNLLNSILDVLLVVVCVFMVLDALKINVGPALASAGIGGIAIGFGAQTLVKDVISGIFLILEDQYGIGDFVTIGDLSGTIQDIGLRVTRLQDAGGEYWYVRNGEISTLGNQTQGWTTSYLTFPVARKEDPFRIIALLSEVCEEIDNDPAWHSKMLEKPQSLGLSQVDDNQNHFMIATKCPGNQQWAVEREVRARVMSHLSKNRIGQPAVCLLQDSKSQPAALPTSETTN